MRIDPDYDPSPRPRPPAGRREDNGIQSGPLDAPWARVVLESPYAGNVSRNLAYARACLLDCLNRHEAPLASHLLYTQPGVLDDTVAEQRAAGIEAGLSWSDLADYVVVYTDLGISPGMRHGIEHHQARGQQIEFRSLGSARWVR